jgi:hypothetical protein
VILDGPFVNSPGSFVVLSAPFVKMITPFVKSGPVFVKMMPSRVKFSFTPGVLKSPPLPIYTGCCCVRQCSEPKPQTKSTA